MEPLRKEAALATKDMAAAAAQRPADIMRPTVVEKTAPVADEKMTLFPAGETQDFRTRWESIQTGFVDEPRKAVEQADALVATTIQRLAAVFAEERTKLEGQWDRGGDVSTEDLRMALRRYRSFFDRLLSV
jgi:hypothetical protein